jgi:hypothetical protein
MAFSDWLSATADRVRTDGLSGVRRSGYELYLGGLRRALSVSYDPEYVWDRDWDVLLILDACRTDLMLEVADDYDYIDGVGEFTTAASSTTGWTEANFDDRFETEMATTGYVTGNPNSVNIGDHEFPDTCECGADVTPNSDERHQSGRYTCGSCETVIDGDRRHPFGEFVEAWRYNWDNDVGTIHPESVTSHAIEMIRETDLDRYIVHYNQPHQPFVDDNLGEQTRIAAEGAEKESDASNIWTELEHGAVETDTVWRAYRENLTYVLDSLPLLFENVDAETVAISSDHGNALGELGVYGHPRATMPLDVLVDVPWIETTAENIDEVDPETLRTDSDDSISEADDVERRLADLGYL